MNIHLDVSKKEANRVYGALILICALLVLSYLAGASLGLPGRIRLMLDLNRESSIPTWFASSQLLIAGLMFIILAQRSLARATFSPIFLPLIGVGFIFLSMDEASGIHETVTAMLLRFSFLPRFTGSHGIWITIYIVIAMIIAVLVRRDIFVLFLGFRKEALVLTSGFAIFIAGGIGLEIVGYLIVIDGTDGRVDRWLTAAEELFELVGISTVLYSTLLLNERFTRQAGAST